MVVSVINLRSSVPFLSSRHQTHLLLIGSDVMTPVTVTLPMRVAMVVTVTMAVMTVTAGGPHAKQIDGQANTADPQQPVNRHQLRRIHPGNEPRTLRDL